MRIFCLLGFFFQLSTFLFSQNIIEALHLINKRIEFYQEGSLVSTDTIIDLERGYYETFSSNNGNNTQVRQAYLLNNKDGSKTLGISNTDWDFVCYQHETQFYEISKQGNRIQLIMMDKILPDLQIRSFITDPNVYSIIKKYASDINKTYLGKDGTIDMILSEIYTIVFSLRQQQNRMLATLELCDYIPTNEVEFAQDDWNIIKNGFSSIELVYDPVKKVFLND